MNRRLTLDGARRIAANIAKLQPRLILQRRDRVVDAVLVIEVLPDLYLRFAAHGRIIPARLT